MKKVRLRNGVLTGRAWNWALQTIAGLKRQLLELLSANSFVARGMRSRAVESLGRRIDGSDGVRLALQVRSFLFVHSSPP